MSGGRSCSITTTGWRPHSRASPVSSPRSNRSRKRPLPRGAAEFSAGGPRRRHEGGQERPTMSSIVGSAGAPADVRKEGYQSLKVRIHQELLNRLNLERLT